MIKRLTEHHPSTIKIRKVEQLLYDLKISIEHRAPSGIDIIDSENNLSIRYLDLEESYYGDSVASFPYPFETKLLIGEPE